MNRNTLGTDGRAKVGYTDVVMTFAAMVGFLVVAPYIFRAVTLVQSNADPLTGVLVALVAPLLLIGLIVSIGVSARGR